MKRREFILSLSAIAASASFPSLSAGQKDKWGAILPQRVLGKTGETVTCLGLGGYHIGWTSKALAAETIEAALQLGIRFFDTSEAYGKGGESEKRYGEFLTKDYRDQIFLMTKTWSQTGEEARQDLEGSLRRLKTDVIDLWQIHGLKSPQDVDDRLENGVLECALQAQKEGKVRHIGFTGHADPHAHLRMLERTKENPDVFAACQFPVNPVDVSAKASFVTQFLPEAQKRGYGILAMKTLAAGRFFNRAVVKEEEIWNTENPIIPNTVSIKDCTSFALSLPVSVAIVGAEKPEFVRDKVQIAKDFQKLSQDERLALVERVALVSAQTDVEYYKNKDLRG